MQQLHSAFWVSQSDSGDFNGVLTSMTPSALFSLGATSRSLYGALRTPAGRAFCQTVCSLKAADWVYIDDLTSVGYNSRYAQVLGLQDHGSSKVRRYGCAIYGVPGKKVYDRAVHQQMFRAVSLPVRSLFKIRADVAAVRLYADGEVHPADATPLHDRFYVPEFSYIANVQIPAGLLGCMTRAQRCPSMNNTSMPMMLQEMEMLNAGDRRCRFASILMVPTMFLDASEGEFDSYGWDAGPHLVFRADGVDFRVKDLLFVHDFLRFAGSRGCESGSFGDRDMPFLFKEFHAQREHSTLHEIEHSETPARIDEEVAATMADIGWADEVEKRVHADLGVQPAEPAQPSSHIGHAAMEGVEKINLLRIGSPSKSGRSLETFRQTLLHGKHFQRLQSDLEDHGLSFVLPEQALMLVTPAQYADARRALKDIELHPFHLIVAEQFDYLIEEILADIPCKQRPRVKDGAAGRQELCALPRKPRMEDDDQEYHMAEEGTGSEAEADMSESPETGAQLRTFVVRRTFLCEAPVLKSDTSVSCHSTTEVHVDLQQSSSHYGYSRGVNPRRFA